MKENEAIGYLLNKYLVVDSPINPPKEECEKHNAVLDMAIKSIEKQIPNKPYFGNVVTDYYIYDCMKCPCCNGFLVHENDSKGKHNYCHNCGQKLDWNDWQERKKICRTV